MQLNIKVVKKWQPPPPPPPLPFLPSHFFINISFQGYPPFLAKFWVSPQVIQFFEGPTPPLIRRERGGRSSYTSTLQNFARRHFFDVNGVSAVIS